jgi:hypothetical protein
MAVTVSLIFADEEEPAQTAQGATDLDALKALWPKIKCDSGPLSGKEPKTPEEYADRVFDAYGGEGYLWAEG